MDKEPAREETSGYCYPADLADAVRKQWPEVLPQAENEELLPDAATLTRFFSICYHAGMLREEERPVVFRAIFAAPELFAPEGRPPEEVQRLRFARPLAFDTRELRRLAMAAAPQRMLIGVWGQDGQDLHIWGLINSGPRWLRESQGGRRAAPPLPPPVPVLQVDGPGNMSARKGNTLIATLQGGQLSQAPTDLFTSGWLQQQFTVLREHVMARHHAARHRARTRYGERWAHLDPSLMLSISVRMIRRVIAMLRSTRHGGAIIFIPTEAIAALDGKNPCIDIKYRFADDRSRFSFSDLVVDIINRLAQLQGTDQFAESRHVDWTDFENTTDERIVELDEALFENASMLAGLLAVDGALVLNRDNHSLVGFGGMISGSLPEVRIVARAWDREGERISLENTDAVGTRHRSAYRLAEALPGAVIIVVSQDGDIRLISKKDGYVTCWEQR